MALQPQPVLDLLRDAGPTSSRSILARLRISQPTLSRLVCAASDRVVRIGRARSTQYALARAVRDLGSAWPLYRVDAEGRAAPAGTLHAIHPHDWWFDAERPPPGWLRGESADGLFPDLPWFLDDARPQGFMGRAFARRHGPALGLGDDPSLWDADGVCAALLAHGTDLPGGFVVGRGAMERVQRALLADPAAIAEQRRPAEYAALVEGAVPLALVGGDQPKFTACVRAASGVHRHVLVKFSPSTSTEAGRRWSDLLRCEHLAALVLRSHGIAASETEWVEDADRSFLEVRRFDRVGAHGRRGVVSLLGLACMRRYKGFDTWLAAAAQLERDRWLAPADAATLRLLWWFGRLIANTDMHLANASFFLDGAVPLRLTPAYDMLPMLYRPSPDGDVVPRTFDPPPPAPGEHEVWCAAATVAQDFWSYAAEDPRVSDDFREEAARALDAVAGLARRV